MSWPWQKSKPAPPEPTYADHESTHAALWVLEQAKGRLYRDARAADTEACTEAWRYLSHAAQHLGANCKKAVRG